MDRHEYKRQNEERAARRETNLAQESQAQIEEQRAASLALYRASWRYKVRFIKWRPAWWNTPSDRFAFFIALFTAVLAIVAYFQLAAMKHTDEAINEQLQEMRRQTATTRAQIRANIGATGLIAQAAIQNGTNGWIINPTWKNNGSTDAIEYRNWWSMIPVEGIEGTAKSCPKVARPEGVAASVMPPGTGVAQVSLFLTAADATRAMNHQIAIFAVGHLEYLDIFPNDPPHHFDWCVLVIPNDTAHNMFSFLNLIQDVR